MPAQDKVITTAIRYEDGSAEKYKITIEVANEGASDQITVEYATDMWLPVDVADWPSLKEAVDRAISAYQSLS